MKKVGVVLSGCGVYDGSEIHEATLTLYFLDRLGAKILCMAPDVAQMHVIDHVKGEPVEERRNVLVEAARIARGEIRDLKDVKAADLDALIFPGGFGAAKNLSDFAVKGVGCMVHPDVERLIRAMHASKKPLGFICIAPVLAAKVLGSFSPRLTVGCNKETAAALEKLGARHIVCRVDEVEVDAEQKIVTTPAYMLGPSIAHVAQGIEKLVHAVVKLAG
ncbi:MAG: Enhancing lycopene biosynthesis protein 2 [Syntrophaceae bacterium PtaU1.Bin231]|nr:MAG: Enhancing lycopene biosynthesis protein 2 [Syntrophaceae bacterium PtaU1.Bin231]HOG18000.1 isoprenoid biosynthesis glyoxalase ElbB [Syntrophales bacterium]